MRNKNANPNTTEGSTTMADTKATAAAQTMTMEDLQDACIAASAERNAAWMIQNGTGIEDARLAGLEEKARSLGDELAWRLNG